MLSLAFSIALGLAIPLLLGATTDEIIQNVYDPSNTAFRVNVVAGSAGGGAPTDATYVTQTPDATLTAEQPLNALASGIMRVATTTGVVTSLTTSAGVATNISDETGTGAMCFATSPTIDAPLVTGRATFGTAVDAANAVDAQETAGCITFEGSSADGIETRLCVVNPAGADTTINLPNAGNTRTAAMLQEQQTFTANQTFTGTIVDSRTTDIGWSVQSAANQACNTTCTNACVVGFDLVAGILGCTDALADQCLCAGSS